MSEISDEADDILNCQEVSEHFLFSSFFAIYLPSSDKKKNTTDLHNLKDELQISVLTASNETNVEISYSSPRYNTDKDLDLDKDLCIELDGQNFKPDYEFVRI